MTLRDLEEQYRQFIATYTARELFDLIFTDYKNAPSELAKIPNLENYAKQRVSQIIDATGITPKVVEDFFTLVQEVKLEVVIIQEEAAAAEAAAAADGGGAVDSGGGGG